jgi:hypothetical protein
VEAGARKDLQWAYCCSNSLEKQDWALPKRSMSSICAGPIT